MIAALYTALCFALQPIGYGAWQFRVAEALTLLPVFSPLCIWGVTLGCAMANLVGFLTGANILGAFDIIFGTLATLIAAILSYRLRNIRFKGLPVASAIPPVLVNALVIGLELTYMLVGTYDTGVFAVNALQIGLGQTAACFALGLPLCYMLEKTGIARKYLENRL
jgi:uncharacterized membrane protein